MVWQVNQKMMLTLTASIMYWCLQNSQQECETSNGYSSTYTSDASSPAPSVNGEDESSSLCSEVPSLTIDDAASDITVLSSQLENGENTTVE